MYQVCTDCTCTTSTLPLATRSSSLAMMLSYDTLTRTWYQVRCNPGVPNMYSTGSRVHSTIISMCLLVDTCSYVHTTYCMYLYPSMSQHRAGHYLKYCTGVLSPTNYWNGVRCFFKQRNSTCFVCKGGVQFILPYTSKIVVCSNCFESSIGSIYGTYTVHGLPLCI